MKQSRRSRFVKLWKITFAGLLLCPALSHAAETTVCENRAGSVTVVVTLSFPHGTPEVEGSYASATALVPGGPWSSGNLPVTITPTSHAMESLYENKEKGFELSITPLVVDEGLHITRAKISGSFLDPKSKWKDRIYEADFDCRQETSARP